jgi:hypothetical protein
MSPSVKAIMKLSPLLAIYIALIVITQRNELWGDETGYLGFATNLTHGYYSPPAPDIDLWWGPGYPMVLAPFVLLMLPWIAVKLLNAFFLFFAVVYFHQTVRLYSSSKYLVHLSYLFGFYLPFLRYLSFMITETLVVFLMSAITYHFCKLNQQPTSSRTHQVLAGLFLGYLALTKVFYGYVIAAGLVLAVLMFILLKRSDVAKRAIVTCGIGFLVCLPYLAYTYSLTGKLFYWGTSGGVSLYYMSSPFDDELGSWGPVFPNRARWAHYAEELRGDPTAVDSDGSQKLAEHHLAFFDKVAQLPTGPAQDDAFKSAALANIRAHPFKYLKNWIANVGRLLFDYPYSSRLQTPRTYFFALPNMFIFVFGVVSIYPLWRYRRVIPTEIYLLLAFSIIAIGGTSLISAQSRQFNVLTPILGVVIFVALGGTRIAPSVAKV